MLFDWWTLTLQAVNVLILAWILARFFYRPVSAIIAQRQAEAQKALLGAEAAQAGVEKAQADIAATRKGLAAERERVLADAKKEADAEHAALLKDAQAQADALRAENEAHWRRERAAAEGMLVERAGALAVDIARRLLDRLPKDVATHLFVDSLCTEIRELPESERKVLGSAIARGAQLAVVSAAPLDDAERRQCADALAASAGAKPALEFRTDPALIAGLEIRGPEIVLSNSWRDDLDRMAKDLDKDAAPPGNA
jgi:F-type H+-transporting ATPase subunit b